MIDEGPLHEHCSTVQREQAREIRRLQDVITRLQQRLLNGTAVNGTPDALIPDTSATRLLSEDMDESIDLLDKFIARWNR